MYYIINNIYNRFHLFKPSTKYR